LPPGDHIRRRSHASEETIEHQIVSTLAGGFKKNPDDFGIFPKLSTSFGENGQLRSIEEE
jgi:hypothetical protein